MCRNVLVGVKSIKCHFKKCSRANRFMTRASRSGSENKEELQKKKNILCNSRSTLKLLYSTLWSDRSKERFDVLEPLQAMTQLALLSFYPVGTKVSTAENVLYSGTFVEPNCKKKL